MLKFEKGDTNPPADQDRLYAAGIHIVEKIVPNPYSSYNSPTSSVQVYGNAIECYSESIEKAEEMRDFVLSCIELHTLVEKFCNERGRSRTELAFETMFNTVKSIKRPS